MFYTPEGIVDNIPFSRSMFVPGNILVIENNSDSFLKYLVSNRKLMFADYVHINQIVNPSEQTIFCDIVFQRVKDV